MAELGQLREVLAARVAHGRPPIEAAFRRVPRHLFLPDVPAEDAYADEAIVTKRDVAGVPVSSSSQPAIMAIMLDQLALVPGQRVLEIGAGTGYNAALIREIVTASGQVTSIDIDLDVARDAAAHLGAAGYQDVTVLATDGAQGCAARAPYDRIIATVGVSDLAPAWLAQAGPDAVIVVPLDVRGAQLAVAFQRAAGIGTGRWSSRSIAPCGFMRMRGTMPGGPPAVELRPGLRLRLPEERPVDAVAVADALAAPPAVAEPTGVRARGPQVFWGMNLWLAINEPCSCELTEEVPPGRKARLASTPLGRDTFRVTYGIVCGGGIATLSTAADNELVADGYGADAAALAAHLAAHVRAWGGADRPSAQNLRIDAFPRAEGPAPPGDTMIVERPWTRFAVYHT